MDLTHHMNWVELTGYAASLLVFSTFYMKTMIPLRTVAIVSNVVFMTYGFAAGLYPVLFLHVVLFPLNILRLYQMRRLIERVRRASRGGYSVEWMLPFMARETFQKGHFLFRKGDEPDRLYYIEHGSIRLPEIDVTLGPGEIIGEIGVFSPSGERTASAVCETDTTCFVLNNEKVLELYFQNPEFGLHLVRMIIRRLLSRVA